jgi:RNA polymerase sigma-70 factor (ECF subfamily)
MDDKSIVELYLNRDESAIDKTQQKYQHYLTKIAYNILSDIEDSEESVNETYLATWNSIPPHKPDILSTYLAKLTRRISIDIFRKRNRTKRQGSQYALSLVELEECLPDTNTPEQTLDNTLLSNAINSFLRTLPENTRNIFIGRYYYLDSVKDVARYCGISEAKAKTVLYRTRCKLKEYLTKEGFNI